MKKSERIVVGYSGGLQSSLAIAWLVETYGAEVVTVDPLHDETWTQGYRAHRGNELDNLEAALRRRTT